MVGPRDVFYYLALVSSIAVFLSLLLPGVTTRPKVSSADRMGIIPMPSRLDLLIFWMGFAVDGIFTMTLAVMFTSEMGIQAAMVWAGLVMSGRRVLEMISAPFSGFVADRFGVHLPLVGASFLLASGLILVGFGLCVQIADSHKNFVHELMYGYLYELRQARVNHLHSHLFQ